MPSTYIVITRKTLQSLSNSFANPLANWFFHLSSYEFPARVYIYIFVYIRYIFQCLYFGWKNGKKRRRKRGIDGRPRPSRAKNRPSFREPFSSRARRTRHFDPFASDARSFGVFLSPLLNARIRSSRAETRRGRKGNIRTIEVKLVFVFVETFRIEIGIKVLVFSALFRSRDTMVLSVLKN